VKEEPDDREGVPKFVRRKAFESVPRLCVKCLTPLQRVSELGGWMVPQDYYCPNCGYRGYVYVEAARPVKDSKDS